MKQKYNKIKKHFKLVFGLSFIFIGVLLLGSRSDFFDFKNAEAATQVASYNKDGEFTDILPGGMQGWVTEDVNNFTDTWNNVSNTHSGTINLAFTYTNNVNPTSCAYVAGWFRLKSFTIYDINNNIIHSATVNATFNASTNAKTASWSNVTGGEVGRVEVTLWSNSVYPGGYSGPFPGPYICHGGGLNQGTYTYTVTKNPPTLTPGPITVYGSAQLAIYDTPTVQLQVNGSNSATIYTGESVSLSWATNSANTGNSCTASNNASQGGWSGAKDSAGGSQSVGPFGSAGSFTFNIYCTGALGSTSPTASVTVNVSNPTPPSFSMNCSPANAVIEPGSSTSFNISLSAHNGFNQVVHIATSINPPGGKGSPAPIVSIVNNDQVPPATILSNITTSASTAPNTYYITYTASSSGYADQVCIVELEVETILTPESPVNVSASNGGTCGTITINWRRNASGVEPTAFRVYRRTNPSNPWQQLGSDIPYGGQPIGFTYTVTDNSPLSSGGSNYYAVSALYNSNESAMADANPSPIVPVACAPNISTSDKDVVSVSGRINRSFTPLQCSGASEIAALPNNALFAPGDVITFQINVCNTGTQALTGVNVTDTFTNLSGFTVLPSSPPGCVTGSSVNGGSVTFTLANVAATNGVCAIRLSGVVTAPPDPSAAIYRFQNRALITANGGSVTRQVYTPPYLFSIIGGVPDRGETSPQQQ